MNNTQQILEDMRKLTMLNGEISSIHEMNLKKWPFVAFDGVVSAEVDYDLTKETTAARGEGFVDFKLAIEPMAENKLLKQRCETIAAWVRDMFWNDIKIDVYFNGIRQYSDSTKDAETAEPNKFKIEKPYNEAIKEVKKGPKREI